MLKKLLATLAVAVFATGASAATYNPVGVQNDVAVSTVAAGGWSVIYSGNYSQTNINLAAIFANAGSKIMLAARIVGSDTYDVLAAIDSSVYIPLQTAWNGTVTSNGAEWYKNGYSMGFVGLGDTIYQSSADINGSAWMGTAERDRLSWHTNIEIGQNSSAAASLLSYGWRSGSNINLNSATDWERVILTNDVSTVPVPATLPLLLAGIGGVVALRRKKA